MPVNILLSFVFIRCLLTSMDISMLLSLKIVHISESICLLTEAVAGETVMNAQMDPVTQVHILKGLFVFSIVLQSSVMARIFLFSTPAMVNSVAVMAL